MKYGAVFASVGILLSIVGVLFFDEQIVIKSTLLIVGLVLALFGIFSRTKKSNRN